MIRLNLRSQGVGQRIGIEWIGEIGGPLGRPGGSHQCDHSAQSSCCKKNVASHGGLTGLDVSNLTAAWRTFLTKR